LPGIWNAMADNFMHRCAAWFWDEMVVQRRRLSPSRNCSLIYDLVYLIRCYPCLITLAAASNMLQATLQACHNFAICKTECTQTRPRQQIQHYKCTPKNGQFKLQCIEEVPTPGSKTLIQNRNSMAMQQIQD
jgi:hypothetical protein